MSNYDPSIHEVRKRQPETKVFHGALGGGKSRFAEECRKQFGPTERGVVFDKIWFDESGYTNAQGT